MVCLTIAPVFVLTWAASRNTMSSVEKEILNAGITNVEWAAQYLDELIIRIENLFYSLQIDQTFSDVVENKNSDLAIIDLQKMLISAYFEHSRVIDSLDLYIHSTGEEISVNAVSSGHITYPDIRSGKWTATLNGPINIRLTAVSDSIYAVHSLNTFFGRELRGGLAASLNNETIDLIMNILSSDDPGDVFIFNETGQLVAGSTSAAKDAEMIALRNNTGNSGSETVIRRNAHTIVLMKTLARGGLTIIKTIPNDLIAASSKGVLTAGLLTSAVLIAAALLLSILFSLRITRPVINLVKTMEQTNLLDFEHLDVQSHDEIGLLEKGYNSLMSRMKELVEKEYQREIDLRNAKLDALYAQINPHFLYNTLNLIGGMALSKNSPEIYRISKAIGDLFRYNTANEGELVTLEREKNHISNYLMIQEMRYDGRCSINYEIADEIAQTLLPQFTLQPILENAFEHGLQPKSGEWKLLISGKRQRQGVMLIVEDNGVGMDSRKLKELRLNLADSGMGRKTGSGHIGLKNVDSRIKLHFGENYGLRIFSSEGIGTRIVLKLPHAEGEEVNGISSSDS